MAESSPKPGTTEPAYTPDTAAPVGAARNIRAALTKVLHSHCVIAAPTEADVIAVAVAAKADFGASARSVAGTPTCEREALVPDEAWQAVEDLYLAHRVELDDFARTAISVAFSAARSGTAALPEPDDVDEYGPRWDTDRDMPIRVEAEHGPAVVWDCDRDMDPDTAERHGLALLAAARTARRLASEGGDTDA